MFIIFLQKNKQNNKQTNRHLTKKMKDNALNDFCVPLFNFHYMLPISDWGMKSSKLNSRFEIKAETSVWSIVWIVRKAVF